MPAKTRTAAAADCLIHGVRILWWPLNVSICIVTVKFEVVRGTLERGSRIVVQGCRRQG
jgi:hypothetical protein